MLLAARKVARFYGSRLIFKEASLEVIAGRVLLLTGANGAGKSTLMKILAGLIRPSAGEVRLGLRPQAVAKSEAGKADRLERAAPQAQEPRIGYLGHQTFLYPELSALENLRFWAAMHKLAPGRAALTDILERVELAPFAAEKAGAFSRGMAQRLNLARIFMIQPDVLLLDEPGTGLDVRSSGILHREINAARTRGAGIVWITHSVEADLERADAVAHLENKRLRVYADIADFRANRTDGQTGSQANERNAVPAGDLFAPPLEARGGEPC